MMSLLYVIVGVKHFTNTDFFVAIVPPIITWKEEAVLVSGLIEVILGILLLFNQTRKLAAAGIILLLIAVYPANIYLAFSEDAQQAIGVSSFFASWVRLPIQFVLIGLAFYSSKT